jgi:hypothetical protein
MIADARQITENISYADWLKELRKRDVLLVRNGDIHFRAELTDATPCFLLIGKLKFRRDDGRLVLRQRVNRMNLRLVRSERYL